MEKENRKVHDAICCALGTSASGFIATYGALKLLEGTDIALGISALGAGVLLVLDSVLIMHKCIHESFEECSKNK